MTDSKTALRPLTLIEARVLATLMEKARTVPDSYPLSLNSLLSGCNQKTSRDPLMEVSDAQVQEALDSLRILSLVFESSGGRVARYEHNTQRVLAVPEQSAVLLGLLMLRGPQTPAELRTNSERWYKFADASSVEAFLEELQNRSDEKGGPLVTLLPRAPGAREQRWAHLLNGPVDASAFLAAAEAGGFSAASGESLVARVTVLENQATRLQALEAEVAQLRAAVDHLRSELGLAPATQDL